MGKGRTAGQIEVTSFRIVERRDKAFRRLRDHSCDCLCTEAGGIDDEPRLKRRIRLRSEEHTSELQSLMRNSYAVFCLKNKIVNVVVTNPFNITHSHSISLGLIENCS